MQSLSTYFKGYLKFNFVYAFNFRNLSKKYQPKKNSKEEEEYRYVHDLLLGKHSLTEEGEL